MPHRLSEDLQRTQHQVGCAAQTEPRNQAITLYTTPTPVCGSTNIYLVNRLHNFQRVLVFEYSHRITVLTSCGREIGCEVCAPAHVLRPAQTSIPKSQAPRFGNHSLMQLENSRGWDPVRVLSGVLQGGFGEHPVRSTKVNEKYVKCIIHTRDPICDNGSVLSSSLTSSCIYRIEGKRRQCLVRSKLSNLPLAYRFECLWCHEMFWDWTCCKRECV
jgi:hypothetical protein